MKAITPKDNAATQSGSDGVTDPQTVPNNMDPIRAQDTDLTMKKGDGHLDHKVDASSTYTIQESTSAFLELAFGLKKPIDNKTRKAWEAKFRTLECDATRCLKLDTIIEEVVKKDAIDEDRELSHLQNFFLDIVRPFGCRVRGAQQRRTQCQPHLCCHTTSPTVFGKC